MNLASAISALMWLALSGFGARAESVYVKYRGEIDLKYFDCTDITRSSFIRRVCYDSRQEYMLISLNGTFYHYCENRCPDSVIPSRGSFNGAVL
jgi:hypothetical protein